MLRTVANRFQTTLQTLHINNTLQAPQIGIIRALMGKRKNPTEATIEEATTAPEPQRRRTTTTSSRQPPATTKAEETLDKSQNTAAKQAAKKRNTVAKQGAEANNMANGGEKGKKGIAKGSVEGNGNVKGNAQGNVEYGTLEGRQLYLMKSEPDEFSIDDLEKAGDAAGWEGVRNAQACKTLKSMRLGDWLLFYHSSCKDKGVVGIAEVVREAYPDFHAWDPNSKYYDEKSTQEAPRWFMVDIKLVRKFSRCILLEELRKETALEGMDLLTRPRLSVQRVRPSHWQHILAMETQEKN